MNQILKDRFYTQGNQKWVDYISILTEMNNLERNVFQGFHCGDTDLTIQKNLGLSQKTFDAVEESVSSKVKWGILYCIDFTMRNNNENSP